MKDWLKKILLVCAIALITGNLVMAQSDTLHKRESAHRHHAGIISGYGTQRMGLLSIGVDYTYRVIFIQPQYAFTIHQKKWGIDLVAQPQFNLVQYKRPDTSRTLEEGFEVGINFGGMFRYPVHKDMLWLYGMVSLGPHFISGAPERQAEGFIFSDNFFLGLQWKINDRFCLDLRPGFRHLSNASLKRPNGGINTFMLSGGLMVALK